MPIDPTVAATADAQVAALISGTTAPQRGLVAADPYPYGDLPRFVQLPRTSLAPPTGEVPPDTSTRAPGRTVGWPEIKSRGYTPPAQLRCAVSVYEYQSPSREIPWGAVTYTPGWFVVAVLSDGGTRYTRNYDGAGPETFATRWQEV